MQRVMFVTSHYLNADHKAGFHWLADAFWRAGWHVTFFTESISWLSWLRGDARFKYPVVREAGRLKKVSDRLQSYVWLTPFHPVNLRQPLLNAALAPLLSLYGRLPLGEAEREIRAADLFVFDSDHGLLLFDRFKKLNPHARFIYRMSDHIPMMGHHPLLVEQERRVLERFDLVSVVSRFWQDRLSATVNARVHHHGLQKALFDRPCENPYQTPRPNVIYVGKHHFDADAVIRAARVMPSWSFHVFGTVGELPAAANLHCYAERPFAELVPYLKHADIGLQTLRYSPGAECFTDSLKMQQYTYCRLPIVAPAFLRNERAHVFYYTPGNDGSIRQALLDAAAFDRARVSVDGIHSWDEVARMLTEGAAHEVSGEAEPLTSCAAPWRRCG